MNKELLIAKTLVGFKIVVDVRSVNLYCDAMNRLLFKRNLDIGEYFAYGGKISPWDSNTLSFSLHGRFLEEPYLLHCSFFHDCNHEDDVVAESDSTKSRTKHFVAKNSIKDLRANPVELAITWLVVLAVLLHW